MIYRRKWRFFSGGKTSNELPHGSRGGALLNLRCEDPCKPNGASVDAASPRSHAPVVTIPQPLPQNIGGGSITPASRYHASCTERLQGLAYCAHHSEKHIIWPHATHPAAAAEFVKHTRCSRCRHRPGLCIRRFAAPFTTLARAIFLSLQHVQVLRRACAIFLSSQLVQVVDPVLPLGASHRRGLLLHPPRGAAALPKRSGELPPREVEGGSHGDRHYLVNK